MKKCVHPTGVQMHILRNAIEKRPWSYYLKWFHWHIFAVERCQASALLNARVLLSFSLDGQTNMLQVSSYRLQVKIHELPTKKESKTN